ncbi:5176_t:CDS:2 [Cetraspora pellucida]|uniref:5176_t:CDS:1 n=1 Tax=Cetraspora pellucida TaxID=1433469 RepID=A0ACA9L2I5_9GLOM|nr:5176_t:CDS:2 [Cetraspora pellucida]
MKKNLPFPKSIFINIISNSNIGNLYNCLLVNKNLCEIVIPILWETPFEYLYDKLLPDWRKVSALIQVYISCLSNETKSILERSGINKKLSIIPPPTLNYVSFLKSLDYRLIFDSVVVWLNNSDKTAQRSTNQHYLIVKELFKLFFNHIKYLESFVCKFRPNLINHKLFPNYITLSNLPGAQKHFSYLNRFVIRDIIPTEWCNDIIQKAQKIQEIEVDLSECYEDDEMIAELIINQPNLSKITISSRQKLPCISDALKHKVKSLNTINIFPNISVNLKGLSECSNLIELNLSSEEFISKATFEFFVCSKFSQLKKLYLNFNNLYLDQISTLIRNTHSLQDIYLKFDLIQGSKHSADFINAIADNCPNLINLQAIIPDDEISRLPNLFASCKKLENVICLDGNCKDMDLIDISEPLLEMGKVVQPNLRKFITRSCWTFSSEALNSFLENYEKKRYNKYKQLELKIKTNDYDDRIPIIEKFGRKGVLSINNWKNKFKEYYNNKFIDSSIGLEDSWSWEHDWIILSCEEEEFIYVNELQST